MKYIYKHQFEASEYFCPFSVYSVHDKTQ